VWVSDTKIVSIGEHFHHVIWRNDQQGKRTTQMDNVHYKAYFKAHRIHNIKLSFSLPYDAVRSRFTHHVYDTLLNERGAWCNMHNADMIKYYVD